jgi:hypothetical protein
MLAFVRRKWWIWSRISFQGAPPTNEEQLMLLAAMFGLSIESLNLGGSCPIISLSGIATLACYCPNIETLNLMGVQLEPAALTFLACLKRLKTLAISLPRSFPVSQVSPLLVS